MKRIAILAVLALMCAGCGLKTNVSGTWPQGAGQTVTLRAEDLETVLDETTVAEDGTFKFSGKLAYEQKMVLFAGEDKCKYIFVSGEPVEVTLDTHEGRKGMVTTASVENPSREQRIIEDCSTTSLGYSLMHLAIPSAINKALADAKTQAEKDSLMHYFEEAMKNVELQMTDHLDTVGNSVAGIYSLKELALRNMDANDVVARFEAFDEKVKKSELGKLFAQDLKVATTTAVGGTPEDFTLQTPDGEDLNLYSLRGNYLILDFWASWCAPCKAEMPNVKNIYAKHHKDGLEILGVSIDSDGDAWKNCIASMDLPWKHVSALKGWDCPVAKYFNVTGVPWMFILDPDGKIIAENIRGEELFNFIDNLYE